MRSKHQGLYSQHSLIATSGLRSSAQSHWWWGDGGPEFSHGYPWGSSGWPPPSPPLTALHPACEASSGVSTGPTFVASLKETCRQRNLAAEGWGRERTQLGVTRKGMAQQEPGKRTKTKNEEGGEKSGVHFLFLLPCLKCKSEIIKGEKRRWQSVSAFSA